MLPVVLTLIFLVFVAENPAEIPFGGEWSTFMKPVGEVLFRNIAFGAPPLDFAILALLMASRLMPGKAAPRAKPMDRALLALLAFLALEWGWGMARGGDFRQSLYQIHGLVMLVAVSLLLMETFRTRAAFAALGKTIVLAAVYRGTMAMIFRYGVCPDKNINPPCMTTHADTMLFVSGIAIVVAFALERRRLRNILIAAAVTLFLLLAIHINNRRLAWVSLAGALGVFYALLRDGGLRRRIHRFAIVSAPFLLLYLAIGWGSTRPIFKPAASISSMFGKTEDTSSETRNIENYNLTSTLKQHVLLGTGWGHEYEELSVAYSIKQIFAQYRYIPHNSVLGIWAFTGLIGSTGIWMVFAVGAFLNARAYRFGRHAVERAAAAAGLAGTVIYINQAYGDMGIVSWTGSFLMASSFASASRLSAMTGGWQSDKRYSVEIRPPSV